MVNLDKLFYPNAIALIGVSHAPISGATAHLYALRKVGCEIPIFNISKTRKIVWNEEKAYPSILDVPGHVDYAIIGIPKDVVPQAIKECTEKGVKFVTIFTAGFSEMGTEQGYKLEEEMLENAKGGPRLVGPNCLGPYCRESRVTMTECMEIKHDHGEVSFVCQSGGHTGSFFYIGENRGFPFNKLVSIGNQVDLTIQDFIEYFGQDDGIKVITSYLEKVKKPKQFLRVLRETSLKKPVIFWKGGQTKQGTIAAASHTGAISSSYGVFKNAILQNGGIITESFDELADLTLGSLFLANKPIGKSVGIIVPGGGSAVEMTDEADKYGFLVPELTRETQDKIQEKVQKINTSTRNPVDMGVMGWIPINFGAAVLFLAEDPNIDIVTFYFMIERVPKFIDRMQDKRLVKSFLRKIRQAHKKTDKPIICILPNFVVTEEWETRIRKEFCDGLYKLEIPHFASMGDAMNALKKIRRYQNYIKSKK